MQKSSPKRKVFTQKKGQGKDRVDAQSSESEEVERRRIKIKRSGQKRKRETSSSSNVSSSDSTTDSESQDSGTNKRLKVKLKGEKWIGMAEYANYHFNAYIPDKDTVNEKARSFESSASKTYLQEQSRHLTTKWKDFREKFWNEYYIPFMEMVRGHL